MSSSGTCQECGAALPAGGPAGLCPRCMLGLALTEGRPPDARPEEVPGAAGGDWGKLPGGDGNCGFPGAMNPVDQIPGYRLLQEIGHGGCGVVYLAQQQKPVSRRVALKVIKIGMDTRQVVARFEAERQALARMDHPNIAKVLEAGATLSGRPYFAMELVGGIAITEYCDRNELGTAERLRLFIQVCRAIQHAHQKGIIHRDIKPSNVLVAQHDGIATPKVIDFGIAKATQERLTEQSLVTRFEQFVGTPAYMSPEQAQVGGLDVDTRSDIYSLGVLLYELLTGNTPFKPESAKGAGLELMRRTILEKEPVRPSTRLRTMPEDQLTTVARARRIDPPRLIRMLRGDLDWIVMKCLEKDRGRRYETANGLAMDIERYINHQPVLARPPAVAYQLSKFIGRNRVAAVSVMAISLSLLAAAAVSTWQAVKARRAEREQSRLRLEAQTARQQATEELWHSYLAQARARRMSREAGASFESLAAIAKAAAIRPSLALRNEAIAALAQADIRWLGGKQFSVRAGLPAMDLSAPRYAFCDESGRVSIRRTADDAEVAALPLTNAPAARAISFSADGALLGVMYADHRWRLWDWRESRSVWESPSAISIDLAGDSEHLAASEDGKIQLFGLHEQGGVQRGLIRTIELADSPWLMRFSPDAARLAVFGEVHTNLLIFDLNSGQLLTTLSHAGGIYRVAWTPDGTHLATTCKDGFVHVWETRSGREIKRLQAYQAVSIEFNRAGTVLVSAGWDGRTRLWDFPNWGQLVSIYKSGTILGFGADGRGMSEIPWDEHGLNWFEVVPARGVRTLYVHEPVADGPGGLVVFSHNNELLAFTTAEGFKVWDMVAGVEVPHEGDAGSAAIGFDASDRHLLVTDTNGLHRLSIRRDPGPMMKPRSKSPLSRFALGPPEHVVRTIGGGAILSADGEYCFLAGSNRCQIFDTRTFATPVLTGIRRGLRFLATSPDNSLVAGGAWLRPGAVVWDARTGNIVKEFPTENTTTLAFSPDGHCLVTGTAERLTFWQVGSWAQVLTIPQEEGNDFVPMMAFSRDGRLFASSHSRSMVRLYNAATGEVLADLQAPDAAMVTSVCFNNEGSCLAVCEGQQATRVWDLKAIRSHLAGLGLDWTNPAGPASAQAAR